MDDDVDPCNGWEKAFEAYLGSDEFKIDTDNQDLLDERSDDYNH